MVLDSTSETWNKSVNLDLFQDINVYQHIDESNTIENYQEPNSIIHLTSNNNEFQAIYKFAIDWDDLECFNKKLFEQLKDGMESTRRRKTKNNRKHEKMFLFYSKVQCW